MPNRPHVLLITTDHWPASLLGIAGHPVIRTPTLDQLARNGVRYTNAYSECPVCIPARRTLMTGTPPRVHGDRTFQTTLPMPDIPTLAATFSNAGYQTNAIGKIHVFPQRDRIGFDDVLLAEEGRPQWNVVDDYEVFLGDQGHAGRQFDHAMSNNEYSARPWHLPEDCHVTNWTARETSRAIRRRDPTRPGLWYCSFTHPHPPLVPPASYLDMYRDAEPPLIPWGEWSRDYENLPYRVKLQRNVWHCDRDDDIRAAHRAFYALCTHIDHQLRLVIGTLREEGLLDNTVILFTSDHGDMLGSHGMWAKRLYYEGSANVPMILVGTADDERVGHHRVDDRLVGWQDVMPTLLDLAGVESPESVTGQSMIGDSKRDTLYGECNEGSTATRMLHDGRHKLIYYPAGNRFQLFDLQEDSSEAVDLSESAEHVEICESLTQALIGELYGSDLDWLKDGELVGLPDEPCEPGPNRGLSIQRGVHWPPPPVVPPEETNSPVK
jgi:arylsulfatase A-like enzyme